MLVELNIKNFAIIKDLRIKFTKGLNLLTGETGSGKSIIIEALGIILGGRGSKKLIRTGEDRSFLQSIFLVEDIKGIKEILDQEGIEIENNGLLIISREFSTDHPSMSRINGKTVTLNTLNKITSNLIDIFAQHEHQSLLNIQNHKKLIDSFGDKEFQNLKRELKAIYKDYKRVKKELSSMDLNSSQREREVDLLNYQINEIESINLEEINEEKLENEYNKIENIKNIKLGVEEVLNSLNGLDYKENSILDLLGKSVSTLNNVVNYDMDLKTFLNRLESVNFELKDLDSELSHYLETIDIDDEKLFELNEKINTINTLKKKYGRTIGDILEYKNNIADDLEKLMNYEKEIEKYKLKIKNYESNLNDKSLKLSKRRESISKKLELDIGKELEDLNMNDVKFKVDFSRSDKFLEDGFDNIEFLISTNIGEDLKSMSKIISGGEMSRIMLAFKSILASNDGINTLIFDEIDTGISGRTAQVVGEKIYDISRKRQVISISHLPQIAALADSHYIIRKSMAEDNKINTNVSKLDEERRVEELGRLLGGVDVTETTLNHAREMLKMSEKIKK